MDIVVKYCGGCNCQIDRSKIIQDIEDTLGADHRVTTDAAAGPYAAGILICGCPTACARQPGLAGLAGRWVVIAGQTVDTRDLPEERIAAAVVQIIKEIISDGVK